MTVVYSARYHIDIGPHVFPTEKYRLVSEALANAKWGRESFSRDGVEKGARPLFLLAEPAPASWDDLALVHTAGYLARMRDGTLSPEEVEQVELPWSAEMVDGFRLMVGGTIEAAQIACGLAGQDGTLRPQSARMRDSSAVSASSAFKVVAHIGGGLHHAFPNHGEGFCPFNDVAVAVRVLQRSGLERIAIVDLDVHHGNGTAFIFESDPRVFTFSMHQQHNYPMWKPKGSLDIGLPDGTRDATYLRQLEDALPAVIAHAPQCVFYLAGADPYEDDQLGGLRLTKEGLRQRDRMVIHAVRDVGVPLVVTLAGGYARRLEDTVAIHAATITEALG